MHRQSIHIPQAFAPSVTAPNYFVRSGLLHAIAGLAPQLQGALMDFGCGAKPYKTLFTVQEYIGVDYNSEGHAHTNEQIDVFYDGQKLPFENNRFDSIFASEVFEHVFNLEVILKELNRVLKPQGKILITCPFAICEHEVPVDFARYSSYGIKSLFEKNGFEIMDQQKTGTAVTTVFQLWITYIHLHINPLFKNIPVVRSVFRLFTYTFLNVLGKIFNRLLPTSNDLYLNNIVLAQKINAAT